jgi:hypothetical protein
LSLTPVWFYFTPFNYHPFNYTVMSKSAEKKIMFDGTEGEIILAADANKIKQVHQRNRKTIEKGNTDNYIESEFFGLKTFNKLIAAYKDECVGFRVYYGNTWENHKDGKVEVSEEGKGKKTSRLVIVPVDAYGKDLRPPMGLKDPSGGAVANGPVCPSHCAPPDSED